LRGATPLRPIWPWHRDPEDASVNPETLEALRRRVATLTPAQRDALREEMTARGISWERVAPTTDARVRPDRLPLSAAQLRFWVLQQLNPKGCAYHIAFSWRFSGVLDVEALQSSLNDLARRHEPLRTRFPSLDGTPWQDIAKEGGTDLAMSDLRHAPESFDGLAADLVTQPFDLSEAAPVRAHLFRLGEADNTLVIVLHHIIADGWSRGVMVRELSACYRARAAGQKPVLAPLPVTFSDLVLDQNAWLDGQEAARQIAFWKKQLGGLQAQDLPSDRPPGNHPNDACKTLFYDLPPSMSRRVGDVAARLGSTPFMLLLATFKLLLHRYTGQVDLAVGTPVAGRGDPRSEALIGLFVNTLVLRTRPDPTLSFRQWLDQVRSVVADAFDNQDLPFAQVVDALGVERTSVATPLFQTLFQVQAQGYRHQNAEALDFGVPGLSVHQEMLPLREAKFDLSWYIVERDHGFSLAVEYRSQLFDEDRIARMAGHFEQLMSSVLDNPDLPLVELAYIPPVEQEALLAFGTVAPNPVPPIGVAQALSQAAALHADQPALICDGRTWLHGELDREARRLAGNLRAHPALSRPDARIAICLPRNALLVIAILAALKAGIAYVPLDPNHPADRLRYILDNADVDLVLAQDGVLEASKPVVDPRDMKGEEGMAKKTAPKPDNLAYIIYTSGSTGQPKGVAIENANLLNLLQSMRRRPGMKPGDRLLAVTTVAFDIAGLELLLPLLAGGTVVLADRDTVMAPDRLAAAIDEHRITHMQATPAAWRLLLDSGWPGSARLTALCGGEALDAALAARLRDRVAALWNLYGPTETTIWSAALQVGDAHLARTAVPIGEPIDNTELHVLDAYLQPVPLGIPGELFIGGLGLSRGYWRRPELSAEKFLDIPVHGAPDRFGATRLYRSGDLVSRSRDGLLDFLGRNDHQVKLRGFRIETGEIEAVLMDEPRVAQAVVTLDRVQERLVAYCRLSSPCVPDLSVEELRRQISQRLPSYMIPAAFVFLEAFPLNTNGKIDRGRLPAPETVRAKSETKRAPHGSAETVLFDIWRTVLRHDDVGVDDNFFDLGGDSVMAVQIAARARAAGLILAPSQLFEHQTIAGQARAAVAVPAGPVVRPLSPWQRHQRSVLDKPWLVLLPLPQTSADQIRAALTAIVERHPVLQARLDDGWSFVQSRINLDEPATGVDGLAEWADTVCRGPALWDARLVEGATGTRLAIAAHPLLLDAPSLGFVAQALTDLLTHRHDASRAEAPDDIYAQWLEAGGMTAARPLFRLQGDAVSDPPYLTAPVSTSLAAVHLLERASALNAYAEHIVLTAMAQLLVQWNGAQEIGIDLLTAERKSRALGQFTRLLTPTFSLPQGSMAAKVNAVRAAIEQVEGQGRDPAGPAGDVIMRWRRRDGTVEWLHDAEPLPPRGYALALDALLLPDRLVLDWHFDPARLKRTTVERFASRVQADLLAPAQTYPTASGREGLMAKIRQRKG
jgi:amino acid adenylation domain-containing protein